MTMEEVATALLVWIASHSSYREAARLLGGVYLKQRNVADPLPDRMFLAIWTSRC